MTGERERADRLLVARGLFSTRARAQAAIAAGLVRADGAVVRKPSEAVLREAAIDAEAPHPYVSRGGVKLAAALDAFGIDPSGLSCLDVGASTGGFTDVLLRRGALHVHAVDVGHGQLHPSLASDPRVTSLEGTDIRAGHGLPPDGTVDLATVDVSFISLEKVLPALVRLLRSRSQVVALVKPQFEVGRAALGRGGIVRDPAAREAAVARVAAVLAGLGFAIQGPVPSPIAGRDGNEEALVGGRRG